MNVLRTQREWFDEHPGQVLDEHALTTVTQEVIVAEEAYPLAEAEIAALLPVHLREIDPHLVAATPKLDVFFYRRLWLAGTLRVVTARCEGRVIGYIVMAIHQHPHYAQQVCAFGTLCYLAPEFRGQGWFGKMLAEMTGIARALGLGMLAMGARVSHDSGQSLRRSGFVPFETSYLKVLA